LQPQREYLSINTDSIGDLTLPTLPQTRPIFAPSSLQPRLLDLLSSVPRAEQALSGALTPLVIGLDAVRFGMAFHKDGNRFGQNTLDASGGIAGGLVGSLVGRVVGLPTGAMVGLGIGAAVAGPIGAFAGAEIGGALGSFAGSVALAYAGARVGEHLGDQLFETSQT
jgi:hypothetical protein